MIYDLRMRLKNLIWVLLLGSTIAQKPLPRRTFDAAYIESNVIGGGESCGTAHQLDEQTDPGGLVRDQVMKPIEKSLYTVWLRSLPEEAKPPTQTKALSVIQFRVLADGRLESEKLAASSGNDAFDEVAKTSVRTAQYPPFPKGLGLRWITLQMNFLVNATCGELPTKTLN